MRKFSGARCAPTLIASATRRRERGKEGRVKHVVGTTEAGRNIPSKTNDEGNGKTPRREARGLRNMRTFVQTAEPEVVRAPHVSPNRRCRR